MRFSQRAGYRPAEAVFQLEGINEDLKNQLWNAYYVAFQEGSNVDLGWENSVGGRLARLAHIQFFKRPIDDMPSFGPLYISWLKKWFYSAEWFELYDFVEWHASVDTGDRSISGTRSDLFCRLTNIALSAENAGYRVVQKQIVPITSSPEIDEVELAISRSGRFASVSSHIEAATRLLSHRENPDFRNSIKESISAVEAAARIATDDTKATLGAALKILEKDAKLHPALKEGFAKLYGWTNDDGGIRHAMMDVSNLTLADARFLLVICSAFANYLIDRTEL